MARLSGIVHLKLLPNSASTHHLLLLDVVLDALLPSNVLPAAPDVLRPRPHDMARVGILSPMTAYSSGGMAGIFIAFALVMAVSADLDCNDSKIGN